MLGASSAPEAARFTETAAQPIRLPVINTTYPGYLFMLGTPYIGTVALLGLLSSSPKVTYTHFGWAHEMHSKPVSESTRQRPCCLYYHRSRIHMVDMAEDVIAAWGPGTAACRGHITGRGLEERPLSRDPNILHVQPAISGPKCLVVLAIELFLHRPSNGMSDTSYARCCSYMWSRTCIHS